MKILNHIAQLVIEVKHVVLEVIGKIFDLNKGTQFY